MAKRPTATSRKKASTPRKTAQPNRSRPEAGERKAARPVEKKVAGTKPTAKPKSKPASVTGGKRRAGAASQAGVGSTPKTPKSPSIGRIQGKSGGNGMLPRVPPAAPKIAEARGRKLKPAELEELREMLLTKRRELAGDVANLQNEAMRTGVDGSSGSSTMPIHMADIGSDTWEQELTLGLMENERGLLREIDEALDRMEEGTYGICVATGKPISLARLRAKPWAKYCIEYARKRELGLV